MQPSKGGTAHPSHSAKKGGGSMEVSEIIALLTLLAVVIFGVIDITKK